MKFDLIAKSALLAGGVLVAGATRAAVPTVSPDSVTMTQSAESRLVTIGYRLQDAPAIVTVDIQTNGVSIGGANLTYMAGDVNRRVEPGDRTLTWRPDKAWTGHKLADGVTAVVTAWALETPPDYMVASLIAPNDITYYASADAVPGGVTNRKYKTEYLVMRKIPAANVRWRMGSPSTEAGRLSGREMPHIVTLTNDYYMGIYTVTRRQYYLATGGATTGGITPTGEDAVRPAADVSWNTLRNNHSDPSVDWPAAGHRVGAGVVSDFRSVTGLQLDLPTEAEWEFACRAGSGTAYVNGIDSKDSILDDYAYHGKDGSVSSAQEVGLLLPNPWGLYDMMGNTWEWCLDWLGPDNDIQDPFRGAETGTCRVTRGGSYYSKTESCRCAFRGDEVPDGTFSGVSFRLCCPADRSDSAASSN